MGNVSKCQSHQNKPTMGRTIPYLPQLDTVSVEPMGASEEDLPIGTPLLLLLLEPTKNRNGVCNILQPRIFLQTKFWTYLFTISSQHLSWLVVYLPLWIWKIWVCQWVSDHIPYMKSKNNPVMFETTNICQIKSDQSQPISPPQIGTDVMIHPEQILAPCERIFWDAFGRWFHDAPCQDSWVYSTAIMDWVPKADDDWCFMYIYIYLM